jgi:hypothetical protein
MLLPTDLRDWVPDSIWRTLSLKPAEGQPAGHRFPTVSAVNDAQPAQLLLCGRDFQSRQNELATYENVAVRFIAGNTHPDRHTIYTFQRENRALLEESFVKLLELAAKANKHTATQTHRGVHERAGEQMA